MKRKMIAMVLLSSMLMAGCTTDTTVTTETAAGTTESTEASEPETSESTEEATTTTTTEMTTVPFDPVPQPEDCVVPEGYHFVWCDEFDGDSLSSMWTRETHQKGWVNNELQEYTPDEEYSYVSNGNLIIQPVKKVDDNGNVQYYSGRVNTYGAFVCRYGRIEARIKTPEGVGFLPAFWMLPVTGKWPVSGEIDIMEIVGGQEDTTHGTIHYGNPHDQNQGSYKADVDLSADYHIYAVDWEPGKISFLIDGEVFYETSYWYSSPLKNVTAEYPAPFNQPFYIIFNVAVGGDWPGDPNEDTPFDERAQMRVDWVRVYQRDVYDTNVACPAEKD
ncbi:Glycosyl hydrolases family 16 [Ruminococcaceae bacterium YRB3002]|nr:Glycosyl hydrolases family 16 [Ruminococcaceae bacterium YRB3002]